jgi:hypothetical protein
MGIGSTQGRYLYIGLQKHKIYTIFMSLLGFEHTIPALTLSSEFALNMAASAV